MAAREGIFAAAVVGVSVRLGGSFNLIWRQNQDLLHLKTENSELEVSGLRGSMPEVIKIIKLLLYTYLNTYLNTSNIKGHSTIVL